MIFPRSGRRAEQGTVVPLPLLRPNRETEKFCKGMGARGKGENFFKSFPLPPQTLSPLKLPTQGEAGVDGGGVGAEEFAAEVHLKGEVVFGGEGEA